MFGIEKVIDKKVFGLFGLFMSLYFPIIYLFAFNESKTITFLLVSIIYTLPLVCLIASIRNKWLYIIVVTVFGFMSMFETMMIALYHVPSTAGTILSVVHTNGVEAKPFIHSVLSNLYLELPIVGSILLALFSVNSRLGTKQSLLGCFLSLVLSLSMIVYKVESATLGCTYAYYFSDWILIRPPYNVPFQIYHLSKRLYWKQYIREAQKMSFGSALHNDCKKQVYVLAIGETVNYEHLSLTGYKRKTTPALDSISNITLLTNYYSGSNFTLYSVPQIITRATADNFSLQYKEKSIYEPFQECGFKTFAICSQNLLLEERYLIAGIDGYFDINNDQQAENIVDSLCNIYDKLFIILHYWGNHSPYENFGRAQDVFHPNIKTEKDQGESFESLVNAYDNTVLMTDYNLSNIISTIGRLDGQAALMFVPDHGEDFSTGLCGHGFNCTPSKDEYHVPVVFWFNSDWIDAHSSKWEALQKNRNRATNCDMVFYSMCDMADIEIDDKYQDYSFSIFSSDYLERERRLMTPDGVTVISLK